MHSPVHRRLIKCSLMFHQVMPHFSKCELYIFNCYPTLWVTDKQMWNIRNGPPPPICTTDVFSSFTFTLHLLLILHRYCRSIISRYPFSHGVAAKMFPPRQNIFVTVKTIFRYDGNVFVTTESFSLRLKLFSLRLKLLSPRIKYFRHGANISVTTKMVFTAARIVYAAIWLQ